MSQTNFFMTKTGAARRSVSLSVLMLITALLAWNARGEGVESKNPGAQGGERGLEERDHVESRDVAPVRLREAGGQGHGREPVARDTGIGPSGSKSIEELIIMSHRIKSLSEIDTLGDLTESERDFLRRRYRVIRPLD